MVISINGGTVISSGFPLICSDASMLKERLEIGQAKINVFFREAEMT